MKKQLLVIATLFVTAFSYAQTAQTTFGIRAGLSSATISGQTMSSLNNILDYTNGMITPARHLGIYGGVYASVPLSEQLSFEPGIYYSQKGYELKGSLGIKGIEFLGANAKALLNTNYIDVPILLKGNFNGFQIFGGPQVSYLANAGLKTTAGVLGINLLNNNMDVTSNFSRWDAAITGGIGYQFSKGMNITASYDYGLGKVDANQQFNSYNRAFKVGLGFSF
jgi:hypothetical protein